MINISGLNKTYPNGTTALQDLTLQWEPGIHGLLGPNGAGKTTLMRILATLLLPTAGKVSVFSHQLPEEAEGARRLLGYLPQEFGFYPELTAAETLDYFALLAGLSSRRERQNRIQELLQKVNLWDARRERVGGFSGGMKQRLGIAQMLLTDPQMIILDEPTAGLDPQERISFRHLLSQLFESNTSRVILISTHIVEDLTHIAGTVTVLQHGILRYTGPLAGLASHGLNQVFTIETSFENMADLHRQHYITSYRAGSSPERIMLRFVARSRSVPPGAKPVAPTLEEGYLALLKEAEANVS